MCKLLALILALLAVPALADPPPLAPAGERADRVLVLKGERTLILLRGDAELARYEIALGGNPEGPKERQGDSRTPEGSYVIDWRNPGSAYHLSLHISYPDDHDRARAAAAGVSPGGDIMIHGLPNGYGWIGATHTAYDWTDGCIAVTDEEIEDIWSRVPNGTPIEIRP